jgi:hypothetical protein
MPYICSVFMWQNSTFCARARTPLLVKSRPTKELIGHSSRARGKTSAQTRAHAPVNIKIKCVCGAARDQPCHLPWTDARLNLDLSLTLTLTSTWAGVKPQSSPVLTPVLNHIWLHNSHTTENTNQLYVFVLYSWLITKITFDLFRKNLVVNLFQ